MQQAPSHYAVLGVSRKEFTPEQLKKNYRALALRWHPDRNRGDEQAAAEKFKELQEAFNTLNDPEARIVYNGELDRQRRAAQRAGQQQPRRPTPQPAAQPAAPAPPPPQTRAPPPPPQPQPRPRASQPPPFPAEPRTEAPPPAASRPQPTPKPRSQVPPDLPPDRERGSEWEPPTGRYDFAGAAAARRSVPPDLPPTPPPAEGVRVGQPRRAGGGRASAQATTEAAEEEWPDLAAALAASEHEAKEAARRDEQAAIREAEEAQRQEEAEIAEALKLVEAQMRREHDEFEEMLRVVALAEGGALGEMARNIENGEYAEQQPAEPPTARTTRDHAQPASSGRGLVTTEPTSFAEQQLAALMELGFHAEAAAPYCDGVSSIEEIVDSLTAELEGSELPSSPRGNGGSSDRGQKQRRWQGLRRSFGPGR